MSEMQPVIQARGLMKRYGTVIAMDGADFDLYPGEILAVIGDNGAGKSTLIKALSGAVIPDQGEVLVEGERCSSSPRRCPQRRDRDGLSKPCFVARPVDCRQYVLGPRDAQAGVLGSVFRRWTSKDARVCAR